MFTVTFNNFVQTSLYESALHQLTSLDQLRNNDVMLWSVQICTLYLCP